MPCISAVIICKNEERNIGRCLQSLAGVADEIIVLDGFSTDKTPEICASFPVTFHQHAWMGYAATKNYAQGLASHPYILSLDADEALSDRLKEEIVRVKPNLGGAYSFNRLNNYCGQWIRHCGWYPDSKIRLFEKEKTRWEGTVHETLQLNGQQITHLAGDLLHYTYYTLEEHRAKSEHYASLAAPQLAEKPLPALYLKKLFSPLTRLIKSYLLKAGFLDGYYGWLISLMAAREVAMKYGKAIALKKGRDAQ